MKNHKIYLTNSINDINDNKYRTIDLSLNYSINPKLKRIKNLDKNSLIPKNSIFKSKKVYLNSYNFINKNISYRDLSNIIKIQDYQNKSKNNYYFKKKSLMNKYNSCSSIEKDIDMMKIKMSCNLITHKINQIKNKVQDLHESSIKDDKDLLDKNKKKNLSYNIYNSISNPKIFYLYEDDNNINNNYYKEYNVNKNFTENIKIRKMVKSHVSKEKNNYNNYINNNKNYINNFRTFNNIKNKALKSYNTLNCNSNKNSLRYMLLNLPNNKKATIPIIKKNSFNKPNYSNQFNQKENSFITYDNNLNFLNDKTIEEYINKRNTLLTRYKINKNFDISNNNNKNDIIFKTLKRNGKRTINDIIQDGYLSSSEIRYGSYDKYFINNTFEKSNYLSYSRDNNKLLENQIDSYDEFNGVTPINNKMNDFYLLQNNNIRVEDKNVNSHKNIFNKKSFTNNFYKLNKIINNMKINYRYKKLSNNKIFNNSETYNEINNISYMNKKNIILNNNSNNNNSKLKNENNFNNNMNRNNKKQNNNKIKYNNSKIKNIKNSNTKNNIIINDNNFKININNFSNYSIENNCINLNNNKNNVNNINNNDIKNVISKEQNIYIQKNKNNIFEKNNETIINNNYKKKEIEKLNFNHNYSKDDILRISEKFNFKKNLDNDINQKNNTIDAQKDDIFDLIIQEGKNEKKFNEDTYKINKINNYNKSKNKKVDNIQHNNKFLKKENMNIYKNFEECKNKIKILENFNKKNIKEYKKINKINKDICIKFKNNP